MPKLLILSPYPPNSAGSQRFRYEKFLEDLTGLEWRITYRSFYSIRGYKGLYKKSSSKKYLAVLTGFLRRFIDIIRAINVNVVFIHREATPVGPPFIEWYVSKLLKKKVIYDFDDAIWLTDNENEPNRISKYRNRDKIPRIIEWATKVSCGNEYLAEFARKYNRRVEVVPTIVGENFLNEEKKSHSNENRITIGWTGSHTTLKYLDQLYPTLKALQKIVEFNFLVIANADPELKLTNYKFLQWSKDTEVADLKQIDIGIMPLTESPWTLGKCGFKAIQYMSLGIPVVLSAVGTNNKIVQHGAEGFFAESPEEWIRHLKVLAANPDLRNNMGEKGRRTINTHFSKNAIKASFLSLFE